MILEGVLTTMDATGTLNVAAMGPDMAGGSDRFTLKPFRTSTTFANLRDTGVGVFHITDDVGLIARAVVRQVGPISTRPAAAIRGAILDISGRYLEFRVLDLDTRSERARIMVETVASGRQATDLFGLNRAHHAVVEAAILATRLDFLPLAAVQADLDRLAIIVAKTGGAGEQTAFDMLRQHVQEFADRSGRGS